MIKEKEMLLEYKKAFALDYDISHYDAKDMLIHDLLAEQANDSNSSMFREDITNIMSGRQASKGKHGYDHDTLNIEIKPKNFTGKSKLNAGGQFTDFTWARDAKYSKDNVTMSVSGFNHGKLVFILEFDYNHPTFRARIQEQLRRLLPNGDEKNRYVRSASFTFNHFKDAPIDVKYISPDISKHQHCIVGPLYNYLKEYVVNG